LCVTNHLHGKDSDMPKTLLEKIESEDDKKNLAALFYDVRRGYERQSNRIRRIQRLYARLVQEVWVCNDFQERRKLFSYFERLNFLQMRAGGVVVN